MKELIEKFEEGKFTEIRRIFFDGPVISWSVISGYQDMLCAFDAPTQKIADVWLNDDGQQFILIPKHHSRDFQFAQPIHRIDIGILREKEPPAENDEYSYDDLDEE